MEKNRKLLAQQKVLDQARKLVSENEDAEYPSLTNVTARFTHLSKILHGMPPYGDTDNPEGCRLVVGPKTDGSYQEISDLPQDLHYVADQFAAFAKEHQDLADLPVWLEYGGSKNVKRGLFLLDEGEDLRVMFHDLTYYNFESELACIGTRRQ